MGKQPTLLWSNWRLALPILAPAVWIVIGLILALSAPWLGLAPTLVHFAGNLVPPVVTVACIIWVFVESVRIVSRTGRTLAATPLVVVLVCLFGLLFYEIAAHYGTEHYHMERAPRWWHWLLFVAAHALRAGDLVDVVEAYGFNMQTIHHASGLVAVFLMLFHLVLDMFLIRLLMDGISRFKKKVFGTEKTRIWLVIWGAFFGMFVIVWIVSAGVIRPWRGRDMGLWWLDNLLRIVDFVDAMELFRIRLHNVPQNLWEGTLTFLCRLLIGVGLNELLSRASRWASLRFLGGFGMTHHDLDECARKKFGYSESLRQRARDCLRRIIEEPAGSEQTRWAYSGICAASIALIWLLSMAVAPSHEHQAEQIAAIAVDPIHAQNIRALTALRRMGPHAEGAVPPLRAAVQKSSDEHRRRIVETLGYLGPAGMTALSEMSRNADLELALLAVQVLKSHGPDAAPELALGLQSRHPEVRQASRDAVMALGRKAMPALTDRVAPENVVEYFELFEQIDPDYWFLRESKNPNFEKVCQLRELKADLKQEKIAPSAPRKKPPGYPRNEKERKEQKEQESTTPKQSPANRAAALGPIALPVLPELIELLDKDPEVWKSITAILTPSRHCLPYMLQLLSHGAVGFNNIGLLFRIAEILGEMRQDAREAIPALIRRLPEEQSFVEKKPFAAALARIGPPAPESVPELVQLLGNENNLVRESAGNALSQMNPAWRQSDVATRAIQQFQKDLTLLGSAKQSTAVSALGYFGPLAKGAVPQLIPIAGEEHIGPHAVACLDRIDPKWVERPEAQRLASELAARYTGYAPTTQISLLQRIAAASKDSLTAMRPLLSSPNYVTRISAIQMFEAHGAGAREHAPWIIPLIGAEQVQVRVAAEKALDKIVPDWPKIDAAGPALKPMFPYVFGPYSTEPPELARLRKLIVRVGSMNRLLVGLLIEHMHKKSFEVSDPRDQKARELLAEINSIPSSAIPELVALLAHEDPVCADEAFRTLERADPKWRQSPDLQQPLKSLIGQLDNAQNQAGIERCARALGAIGEPAAAVKPNLIRHLPNSPLIVGDALDRVDPKWRQHPDAEVLAAKVVKEIRAAANSPLISSIAVRPLVQLTGDFGPDAADALNALSTFLVHADGLLRIDTANAIAGLGPSAKKAGPLLQQRLAALVRNMRDDDDGKVIGNEQAALLTALGRCDPSNGNTVKVAAAYLKHSYPPALLAAIDTLGKAGPAARSTLPTLKSFASNAKPPVSTAAEEAIRRIEGKP